jgi:thiol:disulfide interchange protein DsbD
MDRRRNNRTMTFRIAPPLTLAMLTLALSSSGEEAEPKLLEPERAFAFSVQAVDDKTVEARFAIASGYYLYREKLKFSVEPAALASPPVLPPGGVIDDPFFGSVETYRGQLAVRLPVDGAVPGLKVTVRAESQGCADVGVCYPPQVQHVTVALPAPGGRPGAPVAATPAKKSWFN